MNVTTITNGVIILAAMTILALDRALGWDMGGEITTTLMAIVAWAAPSPGRLAGAAANR